AAVALGARALEALAGLAVLAPVAGAPAARRAAPLPRARAPRLALAARLPVAVEPGPLAVPRPVAADPDVARRGAALDEDRPLDGGRRSAGALGRARPLLLALRLMDP